MNQGFYHLYRYVHSDNTDDNNPQLKRFWVLKVW